MILQCKHPNGSTTALHIVRFILISAINFFHRIFDDEKIYPNDREWHSWCFYWDNSGATKIYKDADVVEKNGECPAIFFGYWYVANVRCYTKSKDVKTCNWEFFIVC